MGLIGIGVGPMLSGLQIAMQRTVAPRRIGAAMGTLLLLRQVGAAVAIAGAETIYTAGDDAATATGTGVSAVALVGAAGRRGARCSPCRAWRRASRQSRRRRDPAGERDQRALAAVPADQLDADGQPRRPADRHGQRGQAEHVRVGAERELAARVRRHAVDVGPVDHADRRRDVRRDRAQRDRVLAEPRARLLLERRELVERRRRSAPSTA